MNKYFGTIVIVTLLAMFFLVFIAGREYEKDQRPGPQILTANDSAQFELGNGQIYALVCQRGAMQVGKTVQPLLIVCDEAGDKSAIVYLSK